MGSRKKKSKQFARQSLAWYRLTGMMAGADFTGKMSRHLIGIK